MIISNKNFENKNKTYIMGILNVTPDSFSDGGRYNSMDSILRHAEQMINDGADIIDIGGESTRPGYKAVTADEETERVVPAIRAIKERFDIPISIDTYKSAVALASAKAGADIINDVYAFDRDIGMAKVLADTGLPCCLMHGRSVGIGASRRAEDTDALSREGEISASRRTEDTDAAGKIGNGGNKFDTGGGSDIKTKRIRTLDFTNDIICEISQIIEQAINAGIQKDKIIIDPGVGFGKSQQENLAIINNLERFHELGCPILLGASRKSFIGNALGVPVDKRLEGTIATTVIAVMKGVSFVRVHDVRENALAARMAVEIRASVTV